MNPYLVEGPAVISFSGGRTSGYMLAKIVEAHGGKLPDDVIPIFANTGKEHEKTLEFVEECSQQFSPVVWVEYAGAGKHKVVTFDTASRKGEPFALRIEEKKMNPNMFVRFCTADLKIKPQSDYLKGLGWDEWESAVGLRADEPRRVAKFRGNSNGKKVTGICPLADAGATQKDVLDFWKSVGWGLDLKATPDGNALLGNCDMCFMKSLSKKINIARQEPERAEWWAQQEEKIGHYFRTDQPSYRQIIFLAQQPSLDFGSTEDAMDCACTD